MNIRKHLEGLEGVTTGVQREYFRWLLRYGVSFNVDQRKSKETFFNPEMKACYRNSLLAHIEKDWEYVEGYAIFNGIPMAIEHAWNTENGVVIDTTADEMGFEIDSWFGIVIPPNYIEDIITNADHFTTPLQHYFRIIKEAK